MPLSLRKFFLQSRKMPWIPRRATFPMRGKNFEFERLGKSNAVRQALIVLQRVVAGWDMVKTQ